MRTVCYNVYMSEADEIRVIDRQTSRGKNDSHTYFPRRVPREAGGALHTRGKPTIYLDLLCRCRLSN